MPPTIFPAVLLFTLGESGLRVSSAQLWQDQEQQNFLGDAKNSRPWAGLEQVKQDPARGARGRALQGTNTEPGGFDLDDSV